MIVQIFINQKGKIDYYFAQILSFFVFKLILFIDWTF